jgi:signal transduction histidine kinase
VAQEALTNTVKHANAHKAWIRLVFSPDSVAVSVQDDGSGFNPQKLEEASRPSWGLIGMSERAALLGGHLDIVSRRGHGTNINMEIPYETPGENGYENSSDAG